MSTPAEPGGSPGPVSIRTVIRVLVAALGVFLVLNGIWGLVRGEEPATDLTVGDCFHDEGVAGAPTDPGSVEPVECAEAHDGEVVHSYSVAGSATSDEVAERAREECVGPFAAYVGTRPEESSLALEVMVADADDADGERTVVCYLRDAEGGRLTGSARGTRL